MIKYFNLGFLNKISLLFVFVKIFFSGSECPPFFIPVTGTIESTRHRARKHQAPGYKTPGTSKVPGVFFGGRCLMVFIFLALAP